MFLSKLKLSHGWSNPSFLIIGKVVIDFQLKFVYAVAEFAPQIFPNAFNAASTIAILRVEKQTAASVAERYSARVCSMSRLVENACSFGCAARYY